MPFVLALAKPQGEPADRQVLPGALLAALNQQLDNALSEVQAAADPASPDEAAAESVHEARKAIKRIRAMLRLLSRGLGRARAKAESQRFAQVARLLAQTREAQAMLEALHALRDANDALPTDPASPAAREALHAATEIATRQQAGGGRLSEELRDQALRELLSARERAASWSLGGRPKRALRRGLRRAVRRLLQAVALLSAAQSEAETVVKLHELRKRVKDLYYMSCLLLPAEPAYLQQLADRLDQLADQLGDDHDLALLADHVRSRPQEFGATEGVTALLALLAHRQQALRSAAQPHIAALRDLVPRTFARQVVRGLQEHLQ